MKAPDKYGADSDTYVKAVEGNLSVSEIVKSDWERNYAKSSGVKLEGLQRVVVAHVQNGGEVHRFRNTLFLVTPQDGDYTEIKFHTLTADPREAYLMSTLTFLLGMNQTNGTELAYSYSPGKAIYRVFKRMFGDYIEIENVKDDPTADAPYLITVDIGAFVDNLPKDQQDISGGAYGVL
jgi:hypothetical protein